MESETTDFAGIVGFMVHGMNGMMVVPVVALLLIVVSFFAKVPRGVALAGAVVGLVIVQVLLGMFGHGLLGLGVLHGANALLLFAVAVIAARRAAGTPAAAAEGALPTGRHGAVAAS
jgi:hypothetical protein